ncbi:MAG: alanine racemase [Kiritimatiellia bacterium]
MGNTFTNPDGATETIARPTLLIHRARVELNIAAMAAKAAASGVRFRPHFKTHQSIEVGRWFRAAGVEAITVSSPDMAVEFAADGWDDILIAVPLNPGAVDIYRDLSERIALGLLVDHPDHLAFLAASGIRANVWIKVDAGYGRVGVAWDDADSLRALALGITALPRARFAGLLAHSGQTYQCRGGEIEDELEPVRRPAVDRERIGGAVAGISVGDDARVQRARSPTAAPRSGPGPSRTTICSNLIGPAAPARSPPACGSVLVVSVQSCRNEVVVHGGAVHFSRRCRGRDRISACTAAGPLPTRATAGARSRTAWPWSV